MRPKRTPPPSPAPQTSAATAGTHTATALPFTDLMQHYDSEPDLHTLANRTERKKRKYTEESSDLLTTIKDMFSSFSVEQDKRFNDLKSSIDVMSHKYDEFMSRISYLEKENQASKTIIANLEEKLENLERKTRAVGIEIRNLPRKAGETKDSLQSEVVQLGKTLNVDMGQNTIKDIYRIKSKDASNPVIVDFTTVLIKDKVLKAVKDFNRTREKGNKLNTTHINREYQLKPIYISETLTSNNQKLFYMARQFQKSHDFHFCWTANGIVYLKKNEDSPHIRINNPKELDDLRKNTTTN